MNPETPRITVVIPVKDAKEELVCCLRALLQQTVPRQEYEIVVVDDGSRDNSSEAALALGARVIRQENLGPARARNRGVVEARGKIVAFIDADCVAGRDWLEKLTSPLLDDSSLAGTVGRCRSDQQSVVAKFIQLELDLRYARMAGRDRTDFLGSGNSAFRRDLLVDHPFDECYGRLEDIELSFRLAKSGHRMVYVQGASVRHRHPERLHVFLRRKFDYSRYAFSLYRRYPDKMVSDKSTPHSRRTAIVLLSLAVLFCPLALVFRPAGFLSLGLALASLALSAPLLARAFRVSVGLGLAAPAFLLMGNLAFVAGTAWGFVQERGMRTDNES